MIFTRHHAAFVERQIRTIRSMILKRVEQWAKRQPPNWKEWRSQDFLKRICEIRNGERENATTAMKPKDAEQDENREQVRDRLDYKAKRMRPYRDIEVGNYVQYYGPKKKPFAKEFASVWVKEPAKVVGTATVGRQTMYEVRGAANGALPQGGDSQGSCSMISRKVRLILQRSVLQVGMPCL
jgi:hypothetical protein